MLSDVFLGLAELAIFGVGATILINLCLNLVLRHYVRPLFYLTVLALLLCLGLVDVIAFARAGSLAVPPMVARAIGVPEPSASEVSLEDDPQSE